MEHVEVLKYSGLFISHLEHQILLRNNFKKKNNQKFD